MIRVNGDGVVEGKPRFVSFPTIDGIDVATESFVQTYAPPTDSPTLTGNVTLPSTTSIGTISSTELGYVDGVTSSLQTQLNAKAPSESPTFTGSPTFNSYVKGFGNTVSSWENTSGFTLEDGQSAVLIYNTGGYTRQFLELFIMESRGYIGWAYLKCQISRYGRNDFVSNTSELGYTTLQTYQDPNNVSNNGIRFVRTGTGRTVGYRVYCRSIGVTGYRWSNPENKLTEVSRGF